MIKKTFVSAMRFERPRSACLELSTTTLIWQTETLILPLLEIERTNHFKIYEIQNKFYWEELSQKRLEIFGIWPVDNLIENSRPIEVYKK